MDKEEAKERIEKLRAVINYHRYLYHVLNRQEISDAPLDALKKELYDLEQAFPEFITPDSPTQRVGGKPLKEFKKFTHPKQMLSFNDAFSLEDMQAWEERLAKIWPQFSKHGYYCELKLDGLAIELVYKKGVLEVGATRGDGTVGENVTENLKTVEAIPLALLDAQEIEKNLKKENLHSFWPHIKKLLNGTLVVRGEVFITKKEFARINREQKKEGLKEYANPRNLAAGSVRQLDPKVTASRKLDSFAYALVSDVGQEIHEQEHLILKTLGFKINPHNESQKTIAGVQKFRDHWEKAREKLDYEIDGIVVLVNDSHAFARLGVVGKAPRGGIAYKFAPRESETIIEDIIVQVGRTGVLTPVAVLRPVHIGGTTVSRATLHNLDEIKRLDVKIGDTVIVGRAGDVIPDIRKVIKELRPQNAKEFHMPTKCPVCGQPVEKIEDQVAYRCVNKNCPAIKRGTIYHFVSRNAFDIEGIGPQIIDQLMDAGLIRDSADLFGLKKEDLLNLERFAEKSAQNVIDAIQSKKKVPMAKFIYALGIEHVGEETAFLLARKFKNLEHLANATLEDLQRIPDIGPVVAQGVYDWFQRPYNRELLKKFKHAGVHMTEERLVSTKLSGKNFVITGSLESLSREEAKEKIRNLGGDVSESVSKETDYLVVGAEPGSKYDKAQKLGVKILNEKEFLNMVQ